MKFFDRFLQNWRYSKAAPYVKGRCLDVGCYDGSFLERLPQNEHVGIDVRLRHPMKCANLFELKPSEVTFTQPFQTVSCLATYEHLSDEEQRAFWEVSSSRLSEGGTVLLTVPSPKVDHIIHFGRTFGLLNGMDDHQHREVSFTELTSSATRFNFELRVHRKFQLGLNNLFVFEKTKEDAC